MNGSAAPGSLSERVAALVRRHGPIPFDEVMRLALYDPELGFYASGAGAAGRRRDFITSAEVGPLFGTVLSRAFDRWWDELDNPDPFVVVEAGAGVGTLANAVAAARPRCAPALTYVLAEQSPALRARHGDHLALSVPEQAFAPSLGEDEPAEPVTGTGPRFVSLPDLPAVSVTGVVVANELLDNLPLRLLERQAGGWQELRVGLSADGRSLAHQLVPAIDDTAALADRLVTDVPDGARIPLQTVAVTWVRRALDVLQRGRLVVIDYAATTPELASRPMDEWLRTYRAHGPGRDPLEDLGAQDITCDVCVDQVERVHPLDAHRSQSEFLRLHGIDELVEEGRRIWHERAHLGDLEAIRGRSRVNEAAALLDTTGLGGFRVLEWAVDRL